MKHDALILGGGLAGATVAACLAKAGRDVVLIEKTAAAHDKVCGDFLSHEALHYLAASGIDVVALGAVSITNARLIRRGIVAEAHLPFRALSLRRRILDEALLAHAARSGTSVRRGLRVQSLLHEDAGHTARLDGAPCVSASSVILATGKHDLHGQPRRQGRQNDLVAFKMYFQLTPSQHEALSQQIELILFPGGYAGFQLVDSGLANLCLLITRRQLQRCGSAWEQILEHACEHSPHLATRLSAATPALPRPLALSSIPYGFLASAPPPGVWPVGDQSAVIPSFSGDGMSIALHSAHLAAAFFLDGGTSAKFAERMRQDLRPGMTLATRLSQLLVHAPVAASMLQWFPSLLPRIASATRIPTRVLLR